MGRSISVCWRVGTALAGVAVLAVVAAWPSRAVAQAASGVWATTGTAWRADRKDMDVKGEYATLGMLAGRKAKEAC